jgi:hypothetical protein
MIGDYLMWIEKYFSHFPDQNKFINNKSYSLNVMIEFKLPQETCFEIIDLFNLFLFGIMWAVFVL